MFFPPQRELQRSSNRTPARNQYICSVWKMKRKWCFAPAAAKYKNAAKVSGAAAEQLRATRARECVRYEWRCTAPPLQVNEILRPTCPSWRCASHRAVIENRASSASCQTAGGQVFNILPLCADDIFQFQLFRPTIRCVLTSHPPRPAGEKNPIRISGSADMPDVCQRRW